MTGEQTFDFDPGTRVWKGREFGALEDLAADQVVQLNLTWATIYGPGRCTDIWIDEESRRVASERQRQTHIQHQRRRGIPARVEHVDHGEAGEGVVTATLYAGMDPELYDLFQEKTSIRIVAVEPSLRSYDQHNDFKMGSIREVIEIENPPAGSSGIEIRFHLRELIEGIRPGRTIRIGYHAWPRISLPREESLWPVDLRRLTPGPRAAATSGDD